MDKDKMIEFAKQQCEIYPEDSFMGEYLRKTIKILQEEPCEELDFVQPHKKVSVNLKSCEDAISRQAVLDVVENSCLDLGDYEDTEAFCYMIRSLLPVTPTRKKGKWIDTKEISTNRKGQIVHEVICSECNGISYFRGMDGKYIGANLCPNCGAEMESEEE